VSLDEFEEIIKRKTNSDKGFNYFICFSFIAFSLYMMVEGVKDSRNTTRALRFILVSLFPLLLSVYGIWILKNKHKVQTWNNNLTKEQNIELLNWLLSEFKKKNLISMSVKDHTKFFYKKRWWGLSYSIDLFADKNLIALHIDSTSNSSRGMVDLGASRRFQNKVLTMLKKRSAIYSA